MALRPAATKRRPATLTYAFPDHFGKPLAAKPPAVTPHVLVCASNQPKGKFRQLKNVQEFRDTLELFKESSVFQLKPAAGPPPSVPWFWLVTVQEGYGRLAETRGRWEPPLVSRPRSLAVPAAEAPLYSCDAGCLLQGPALPDTLPESTHGPTYEKGLNTRHPKCDGNISLFYGWEKGQKDPVDPNGFYWLARPKHLVATSQKRELAAVAYGMGRSLPLVYSLRRRVQEFVHVGHVCDPHHRPVDVVRALAHLLELASDSGEKFPCGLFKGHHHSLLLIASGYVLATTNKGDGIYVHLAAPARIGRERGPPPYHLSAEQRELLLQTLPGFSVNGHAATVDKHEGKPEGEGSKVLGATWPHGSSLEDLQFYETMENLLLFTPNRRTMLPVVGVSLFAGLRLSTEKLAALDCEMCMDLAARGSQFRYVLLPNEKDRPGSVFFWGLSVTGPERPGDFFLCHVLLRDTGFRDGDPTYKAGTEYFKAKYGYSTDEADAARRKTGDEFIGPLNAGEGMYYNLDRLATHVFTHELDASELPYVFAKMRNSYQFQSQLYESIGMARQETTCIASVAVCLNVVLPGFETKEEWGPQAHMDLQRKWCPTTSLAWGCMSYWLGAADTPPRDPMSHLHPQFATTPADLEYVKPPVAAKAPPRAGGRRAKSRRRDSRRRRQ